MKTASRSVRQAAEMLAIQVLGFIAEDSARLAVFLEATGIPGGQIRTAAREPGFLAGVLEHMLRDESLLTAFADNAGIDPADIARARRALDGTWERDTP